MKPIISILRLPITLFFLFVSLDTINAQDTCTLTVNFEITKHKSGLIKIALFDNAKDFLKAPVLSDSKVVENNKVSIVWENIPKGVYSFSYYHDVNANDKLDTNFLGIPKEPYGFSNNQKGSFGPPSYEEANIIIEKNTTLNLTIK